MTDEERKATIELAKRVAANNPLGRRTGEALELARAILVIAADNDRLTATLATVIAWREADTAVRADVTYAQMCSAVDAARKAG